MKIQESITQLQQFRQKLYESFPRRADALIDLVDALSSNTTARSVVELSLSPLFRRGYGSVHDSIDNFFQATSIEVASSGRRQREQRLIRLIASQLRPPQEEKFWLFGVDVTPGPRPFARTLPDRTFVYQPNPIRGNKPVAIGHQYSALLAFPEKATPKAPPWVVPLSIRRVTSQESKATVGVEQVSALLTDDTLPFHDDLCVTVADSDYSRLPYLGPTVKHDNLVTIARVGSNRTFHRSLAMTEGNNPQGHPTWYGECFSLKDATTWGEPDEVAQTTFTTRRGQTYTVKLEAWHNLLMHGSRAFAMHQHPFTLIRAQVTDSEGRTVFQRPLWLIVIGSRRHRLSLLDAWRAYGRRYDLEHFFRFGKQRLLMASYQTPDVEHEENWWQIASLAYVQLWLAHPLAEALPRPWECYLPRPKVGLASPSAVQRDFGRIIGRIGTPTVVPKRRGKSPGRKKGERPGRRERHPVLKKGAAKPQRAQRAA